MYLLSMYVRNGVQYFCEIFMRNISMYIHTYIYFLYNAKIYLRERNLIENNTVLITLY